MKCLNWSYFRIPFITQDYLDCIFSLLFLCEFIWHVATLIARWPEVEPHSTNIQTTTNIYIASPSQFTPTYKPTIMLITFIRVSGLIPTATDMLGLSLTKQGKNECCANPQSHTPFFCKRRGLFWRNDFKKKKAWYQFHISGTEKCVCVVCIFPFWGKHVIGKWNDNTLFFFFARYVYSL